MNDNESLPKLKEEIIISKIYQIRGIQVLLDFDLSELYGVETKQLKRAVKRNLKRFPEDFMFELTKEELQNWRCQIGTSNFVTMGLRIPPFAFTEHGILMIASVLNNERAIQINIQLVRIFNKLRKMVFWNKDLFMELEKIKGQLVDHDGKFGMIYDYLKKFEESRLNHQKQSTRKRIGY
jgi:phage regulator Rha-like protein